MALSPDEIAQLDAALEEVALAVNDAIVATTVQQKNAAKTRFKLGMKALGLLQMRLIKFGIQNDY